MSSYSQTAAQDKHTPTTSAIVQKAKHIVSVPMKRPPPCSNVASRHSTRSDRKEPIHMCAVSPWGAASVSMPQASFREEAFRSRVW